MQFITNRIRVGSGKKFEELVSDLMEKKAASKEVIKTAAAEEKASKDEAKSSGQLDVEPLHQTGESTTMPKKGPCAKKDEAPAKAAAATVKADEEGKDSGQPKAEGSEKFTNDPKKPEGKDAAGASKKTTKEAKGFWCDKCKCKKDECGCGKDAEKTDDKEEEKDCSAKVEEKKVATSVKQFVKIANLDAKNKGFLRKYWKQLFGEEYVNALLSDK
jgi:hypothetical protein